MARRRLEAAIQASREAEEEKPVTKKEFVEENISFSDTDSDGVYCLQYSLDGKMLLVGYGDGSLKFLDASTGEVKHETRHNSLGNMPVMCVRFNPAHNEWCLAGTSIGRVYSCNSTDGTVREAFSEPGNEINCLDFCLDGDKFATAGKDLHIRLYDTNTLELVKMYEGFHKAAADQTAGHAQRVFSLRFHPEFDHLMVTGGWDNHLKVWDIRTNDGIQRTIQGPHICADSIDLKGTQVLTGSWVASRALQLWDFGQGTLIKDIPMKSDSLGEFLYCCQFANNDLVLAGGSGTNNVQAINVDTDEVVGVVSLGHPVQALDSTVNGSKVALGGAASSLKMATIK